MTGLFDPNRITISKNDGTWIEFRKKPWCEASLLKPSPTMLWQAIVEAFSSYELRIEGRPRR